MESHVFRLFVTCYLICILCRNASSESKVFTSINGFQPDARTPKIKDTRTERSIKMETRLDGIILKDDLSKVETSQESPLVKDLKTKALSDLGNSICSKYCIQQLETAKDNFFEDINLSWSFSRNHTLSEEGNPNIILCKWNVINATDFAYPNIFVNGFYKAVTVTYNFSLENNSNLKILRHIPVNNKSSIILNNCQIYLNFDCNITKMEENSMNQHKFYSKSELNRENIETIENIFSGSISEFSKKLVHRTNLKGYTEINFYINANVTRIIINMSGNLTRAVLVIPTNRTTRRPGITMSLARTYDKKGMTIGARNLSPGDWCVKLTGVENSKYSFEVIAYLEANEENRNEIINIKSTKEYFNKKEREDFDKKKILNEEDITQSKATIDDKVKECNKLVRESRENTANRRTNLILLMNPGINKKSKNVFERSVEIINPRERNTHNNDDTIDFSDVSLSSRASESTVMENNINYPVYNYSLMSYGNFKIPLNASSNKMFNGKIFAPEQQKIQARSQSSEVTSLNDDTDTNMKLFPDKNRVAFPGDDAQMDSHQNQEISPVDANDYRNNENFFERKKTLLEVNANSNLIAAPGKTHRVVFDVSNNCVLPVRYSLQARSSLRIRYQPKYIWVYPGQTIQVPVDIDIPFATQDTVYTITLFIDGAEMSEKTVQVLVRTSFSKNIDDVKPSIEYSFNNNCGGKLDRSRCEKTLWSANIVVEDFDSGLKRVITTPNDIYPINKFVSGTKERITYTYWSTCCYTTAKITAIDLSENRYTRTIDVTEWYNLSEGEIAAVTVGALLLLVLLILLIIAIIYCVRRRSSHDLPRYGTRQPRQARSERTSF